jgi:hypothetical protein
MPKAKLIGASHNYRRRGRQKFHQISNFCSTPGNEFTASTSSTSSFASPQFNPHFNGQERRAKRPIESLRLIGHFDVEMIVEQCPDINQESWPKPRWRRTNTERMRRRCFHLQISPIFILMMATTFWHWPKLVEATLMSNEHQQQQQQQQQQSIQWEENPAAYHDEPPKIGINTTYISQVQYFEFFG